MYQGRTLTRTLTALALMTGSLSCTLPAYSALLINELDYDQPGIDRAEFIELYNTGLQLLQLEGYHVDLINGVDGNPYNNIDLSGLTIAAGDYLVICANRLTVQNCDIEAQPHSNLIQNGGNDGDAVALYWQEQLIDSLSYEKVVSGFTEGALPAMADDGTTVFSLSRLPNGVDLDQNGSDFAVGCLTPGSANAPGPGDCSVSPVPLPPAAWLFGAGLLGLVRLARSKPRVHRCQSGSG